MLNETSMCVWNGVFYLQNSKFRQVLEVSLEYNGDVVPLQISVNKLEEKEEEKSINYTVINLLCEMFFRYLLEIHSITKPKRDFQRFFCARSLVCTFLATEQMSKCSIIFDEQFMSHRWFRWFVISICMKCSTEYAPADWIVIVMRKRGTKKEPKEIIHLISTFEATCENKCGFDLVYSNFKISYRKTEKTTQKRRNEKLNKTLNR